MPRRGSQEGSIYKRRNGTGQLPCRLKASERPSTQPLGRKFKRNSGIYRKRPGAEDLRVKAMELFRLIR